MHYILIYSGPSSRSTDRASPQREWGAQKYDWGDDQSLPQSSSPHELVSNPWGGPPVGELVQPGFKQETDEGNSQSKDNASPCANRLWS